MKIIVSDEAYLQNQDNVQYLLNEWNIKVAYNYLDKFDEALDNLEKGIYKGKYDEELGYYKYLVVPQIYIFYDYFDKETIKIVSIWNNYKNPYWLDN